MANEAHLAILKQGVEVWNRWKKEREGLRVDLRKADLKWVDLIGADLRWADLQETDLSDVIFIRTNLASADLTGAILTGAILHAALLPSTDLREANVEGAFLAGTVFVNTDLTGVIGLDACRHLGPSTLDHRTLAKNPHLPLEFLRGCGLSDLEIEFAKLYRKKLSESQITDITYRIHELRSSGAIQYHSCFISYSSCDKDFAHKLHDDLQDHRVRCWFAPKDIKTGDRFRDVIEDAVRLHDKVLLILSKDSIKSPWVEDEVEAALEKERKRRPKQTVLFPLRIDDAVERTQQAWAAKLRRERHIGDFRDWTDPKKYNEAFQRLLRNLQAD